MPTQADTNVALTDVEVKKAKPGARLVKLSDSGGLQLWVFPDGAKRWRFAYRFDGKQKTLALGVYPAVSLKEAREAREAAKRLHAAGRDPSAAKKLAGIAKAADRANSFGEIADELLEKMRREGRAKRTLDKAKWLLGIAKPALGARPIAEITAPEVLAVLRGVEARGNHETCRKLRGVIGQVFRYAIAAGRAETDPTDALKGTLTSPTTVHRAAILEPKVFGGLLRAIDGFKGAPETRIALKLAALTFVRPGELRSAEWSEFDLEKCVWAIPAEKMKMRREHRVPLVPQAVAFLGELKTLTGRGKFLFPAQGASGRCMSENTINGALRRLGFMKDEMTGHGFRATASSMLNESGLWNPDAIEVQLAHQDRNAVRRAYARSEYWEERIKMMVWWADRCDQMRTEKPN